MRFRATPAVRLINLICEHNYSRGVRRGLIVAEVDDIIGDTNLRLWNFQAAVFHLWTLTADSSLRIELANR